MEEIRSMDMDSKDLVAERIEQMKALFPEIATEGVGSIDFEKLRLILGDEVDEGDERYAFTWPGKADAIRQAQTVSSATLRPCPEESVDWDTTQNLYIEGDNLEVLKLLQRGYHGKIKMIYIDPPYNTGHDFVYKDRFENTVENYKEQAGISGQSNASTSGRFHSDWCSMMYPRLRLARELLSSEGVLVASIDENERTSLQLLLDEIFGEQNFAGEIIWKNSSKNDQAYVSIQHEYLLIYVKDKQANTGEWLELKEGLAEIYAAFDGFKAQYGNDWKAIHKAAQAWYAQFPDSNPIKGSKHYSWMDERGVYFPSDISGPNYGQYVYDIVHPCTGKIVKAPASGWRYPEGEMTRRIQEGLVHFGEDETTIPNNKTYLKNTELQSLTSILYKDGRVASKKLQAMFGEKVFSNPKDDEVLTRLMQALGVSGDDLVMDFFSGSASSAEAVERLNLASKANAKWIMVQLPENLESNLESASGSAKTILKNAIKFTKDRNLPAVLTEIAKERLRRTGKSISTEVEAANRQLGLGEEEAKCPDIGFRVLKLDASGVVTPEPGQLMLNRVKSDRIDQDIIFEMMLKWGLELTYPIEKISINSYECYSVAGDALICCMSEGLTVQVIQEIADLEPDRVFMLDSILDDTLKLNALQIFKRAEEKTQKKIDLRTV